MAKRKTIRTSSKKVLSAAMSLVLALGLMPAPAFAGSGIVDEYGIIHFNPETGIEGFESEHNPYGNLVSQDWVYTDDEAEYGLAVTFSEDTFTESECDYITIEGEVPYEFIGEYSGGQLAGKTLYLKGIKSFVLRFVTDGVDDEFYGFKVTEVRRIAEDEEIPDEVIRMDPETGIEGFESKHYGYGNSVSQTWVYTDESAVRGLAVAFSEDTSTEDEYDTIAIFAGDGEDPIGKYSGTELAGKTIYIPNATSFRLVFETDESTDDYYGFKVTEVRPIADGEAVYESIVRMDPETGIEGFESKHDAYGNNVDQTWIYTDEGAKYGFAVTFSEDTLVQDGCDTISVYSGDGKEPVGTYTGADLAGKTLHIENTKSFKLRFVTDGSDDGYYGFKVTEVRRLTEEEANPSSFVHLSPETGIEGFESEHNPYGNNVSKTWTYTDESAEYGFVVTFSNDTCTESGYDFVTIFAGDDEDYIARYSGTDLANQTIYVRDATSFRVVFETDSATDDFYGFKVTEVRPITVDEAPNGHIYLNPETGIDRFESIHFGYGDDARRTWTYTDEAAKNGFAVTFSEDTFVQNGLDAISIYAGDSEEPVGTYTGDELAGKTLYIVGTTSFNVVLTTDGADDAYYGFKVTDLRKIADDEIAPGDNSTVRLSPETGIGMFHSAHYPYGLNLDKTWVYTDESSEYGFAVTFDSDTYLDPWLDWLYVYSGSEATEGEEPIAKYTDDKASETTVYIPDTTAFRVRMTSEGYTREQDYYGFSVKEVRHMTESEHAIYGLSKAEREAAFTEANATIDGEPATDYTEKTYKPDTDGQAQLCPDISIAVNGVTLSEGVHYQTYWGVFDGQEYSTERPTEPGHYGFYIVGLGPFEDMDMCTTMEYAFTIDKFDQTITASDVHATYGDGQVAIEASSSASDELRFSSDNNDVASVDWDGIVTINGAGSATVTIWAEGHDYLNPAQTTITVTVAKLSPEISAPSEVTKTKADAPFSLGASVNSAYDGNLSYASDNENVVSVDEDGTATVKGAGTANVTVSGTETANCNAPEAKTVAIRVTGSEAQEISVASATSGSIARTYGDPSFNLGASTTGDGALAYASSDEAVASVSEDGTVQVNGAGTATITVSAAATDAYRAATAEVTLTVDKAEQTLSAEGVQVAIGKTASIATGAHGNPAITYKSADESVAKVDENGNVTPVKPGSTTVAVEAAETANYKAASATVAVTVEKGEQTVTASDKSVAMGKTASIGAKASAGGKLTYRSANTAIAKVDASGKVTPVKAGTVKVTVSAAATDYYAAVSKTITVTVTKGAQAVTASNKSVAMGKTVSIGAKASAGGKLTYKSANTAIAKVSAKGVITPVKAGTVKVTVSAAATANYKAASKTITVKVTKGAQSLSFKKQTKTVKKSAVAKAKQAVSIAKASGAKTKVTYSVAKYGSAKAKSYLALDKSTGKVTVKKGTPKGTYSLTVKASAAGNANWKAASKSAVITVKVS